MNIGNFGQFCEENFPLQKWKSKVKDGRKQPHIPPSTVFKSVMEMVPLSQKSLLTVDQFSRTEAAKKWHNSKRAMVVSDTTLANSLATFDLNILRSIGVDSYRSLKCANALSLKLPSGRRLRVGVVDGSDFGGLFASVFAVTSDKVDAVIDLKRCKYGKELPTTRELLGNLKRKLGADFVDIVVGDGLYITRGHFLNCKRRLHCEALIKTTEEKSLSIIEDAQSLFSSVDPDIARNIERTSGTDLERGVEYRVRAAAGFSWRRLPFTLKVAYVWERHLKPRKGRPEIEEFWVITTDESLSTDDMRELAHRRWHIENNCFKRLNELVGSKRRFIRDEHTKEAALRIWFIGLTLFIFYLAHSGFAMMRIAYRGMKQTLKWVAQIMLASIWREEKAAG